MLISLMGFDPCRRGAFIKSDAESKLLLLDVLLELSRLRRFLDRDRFLPLFFFLLADLSLFDLDWHNGTCKRDAHLLGVALHRTRDVGSANELPMGNCAGTMPVHCLENARAV